MSVNEFRTREAAEWIYAGDLTSQLGDHAACVVGQHIRSLSESGDDQALCKWFRIFNKVAVLLRSVAERSLH